MVDAIDISQRAGRPHWNILVHMSENIRTLAMVQICITYLATLSSTSSNLDDPSEVHTMYVGDVYFGLLSHQMYFLKFFPDRSLFSPDPYVSAEPS